MGNYAVIFQRIRASIVWCLSIFSPLSVSLFLPHQKQLSNQIEKDYFFVRFDSKFVSLLELWQNVARRCAALVISAHLVVIVKSIIHEPVFFTCPERWYAR